MAPSTPVLGLVAGLGLALAHTARAAPIRSLAWLDLSGRPTAQSSTGWGGEAARAIDGNANSNWSGNSCAHTGWDHAPWWHVDLGATTVVTAVKVTDRGDCCGGRLNGLQVTVDGQLCASGVTFNQGETKEITCTAPVTGANVRLEIPGRHEYLTLCEVGVRAAIGDWSSPGNLDNLVTLSDSLGRAASNMEMCHDSVESTAEDLAELEDVTTKAAEITTKINNAVKEMEDRAEIINKPGGIGHQLGMIPKVGLMIKKMLKQGEKYLEKMERATTTVNQVTTKINKTVATMAWFFDGLSNVTEPTSQFLTGSDSALDAAIGCAEANPVGASSLDARIAAVMPSAKTTLDVTAAAGQGCHAALSPVAAVVAVIREAADKLGGLISIVDAVVDAVAGFIEKLNQIVEEFDNAVSKVVSSDPVQCILLVTGVQSAMDLANLATCPADELNLVFDRLSNQIHDLLAGLANEAIKKVVEMVVPDFSIEIPDLRQHLPHEALLATCTAAAAAWPEHAEVIEAVHALPLPYQVTDATLEQLILAEALLETGDGNMYESPCAAAAQELIDVGDQVKACENFGKMILEGIVDGAEATEEAFRGRPSNIDIDGLFQLKTRHCDNKQAYQTCLNAPNRGRHGGELITYWCKAGDRNNLWDYTPANGHIKAAYGICVEGAPASVRHIPATSTTREEVAFHRSPTTGRALGYCPSGWRYITSLSDCEAAAREMKWTDYTAERVRSSGAPKGCYNRKGKLYFNEVGLGVGNTDSTRQSLCRRTVTQTTPARTETTNGAVTMRLCATNNPGQTWSYDVGTGLLRNGHGYCMHSENRNKDWARPYMTTCDANVLDQVWDLKELSGEVRSTN